MMKPIHALRLSLVGLAALIAASSHAQDAYYYGGLSVGQSQARIDEQRITAGLLAGGLTTSSMTQDDSGVAYRLFGGYQFNRYFAMEAGFFNLGKFGFTANTVPAGALHGQIKLQGLHLDLVGTWPLSERWSVMGRLGAQGARARDSFIGTGAVSVANAHPSKTELNYKVGAGLQYEISPSLFVRGEAERYRVNDAVGNRGDIDMVSVSLVFPFGRSPTAAPRPMAAAPAYVVPAPEVVSTAPAPVNPPIVVAAAPPRRVSLSADSLFAWDAADVSPEGKIALEQLAKDLQGMQFEVITVIGHTDRMGSSAYNQRLSMRRAEAVKGYLVKAGRMDDHKISAIGKGESEPVTRPQACGDSQARAQLIVCLQPDRRVDVQVTGTR